ncbi:MAG: hypothetical protein IPK04_22205 [Bdellovibrionales bacterium]|nr:hypothetical protein [Bdellovibrionales bacterium]
MAIFDKNLQNKACRWQVHLQTLTKKEVVKRGVFVLLGLALGACSTDNKKLSGTRSAVPTPERVLSVEERDPSILRDLAKAQSRNPATETVLQDMKVSLLGLRTVNPKKFEIYVFPKNTKQTYKMPTAAGTLLGRPYKVEVSPKAIGDCSIFAKGQFAKYNPQDYFPRELTNSKQTCSIIEFTAVNLTGLPKDLWRAGDVHRKRIYIDGTYRAYGMETDVVAGGRDLVTTKHKLDPREGLSSALDGIPVDLPVFDSILDPESRGKDTFALENLATPEALRVGYDSDRPLDQMSINQIKKLNQKFELSKCSGRAFAYKDSMRKTVKVYWCEGKAWPQAVETKQYFAVTQNLGVK